MEPLILALVGSGVLFAAALALLVLSSLFVILSTTQLAITRWYRNWHKNRLNLRKDRAFQQFKARYPRR
jgi:hypothetical protein